MKDFIKIPKKRENIFKKNKKLKKEIEKLTDTKIKMNEDISIEGGSFNIYQAKQVLKAFGRGFDVNDALSLLDDEYGLEVIDLTEYVKSKKRLKTLKGRIIGTDGKTKKNVERLTGAKISVFGKTVSIIGQWDKINTAREAVMMLIRGSMHQTMYRWLERQAIANE